jgi:hypothetical protein
MGLDLLAAGVLHKNVSVLLIYTPRIDEPTGDYTGSSESQPGALESASLIFSNIVQDAFNLRVGRFEPAFHPFSSKRSYYLLEGYEVYDYSTPGNDFVFNDNQIGIEATGHFRMGFKYGLGVVNGTGARPDDNKFKDVYLTASQTIGPGDGQSAGQRIGAFAYYGKQPTMLTDSVPSPTGETAGGDNKPYYRFGGSASLNWRTLNLEAMYMRGLDDKKLPEESFGLGGYSKDYEFEGGLAELDCAALSNNRLVASVLYNWVKPLAYVPQSSTITAYSGLLRYYFGDYSAVNVVLHAEYTYRKSKVDYQTTVENIYSLLLDFAF